METSCASPPSAMPAPSRCRGTSLWIRDTDSAHTDQKSGGRVLFGYLLAFCHYRNELGGVWYAQLRSANLRLFVSLDSFSLTWSLCLPVIFVLIYIPCR
ncbi:hypothetical protein CPB86DRAFT_398067 [Serendipita vermifera]|nr:hypothetical protein CPB86DRAFT_398067 [Serendipita vermifera]